MEGSVQNEVAGLVCAECGNPAESGLIFCSKCGTTLRPPMPLVPLAPAANREPIDMHTYYKPSQWRGKRLIYRSADPNEWKSDVATVIAVVVTGIIGFATAWLLSPGGLLT